MSEKQERKPILVFYLAKDINRDILNEMRETFQRAKLTDDYHCLFLTGQGGSDKIELLSTEELNEAKYEALMNMCNALLNEKR